METKLTQQDLVKRGQILSQRLELLNDFILNQKETEQPFVKYLTRKGINEEIFLKELPTSLIQIGIGNATANSQRLFDYTQAMNDMYVKQYTAFMEEQSESADGNEGCENCDGGKGMKYEECDGCPFASAEDLSAAVVPIDKTIEDEFYGCEGCPYFNASAGVVAKCNAKYPPPRGKARKEKYQRCLKEEQEKKDTKAKPPPGVTCGVGEKWNKRKGKCVKKGRFLNVANKLNPAMVLVRKSFLSIVSLNLFGIGSALKMLKEKSPEKFKKFLSTWFKLGGTEKRINKSIVRGSKKKMFPKLKKRSRADGMEEYYWSIGEYYNTDPEGEEEQPTAPASETEKPPVNAGKLAAVASAGLAGAAGILAVLPPPAQAAAVWVGASAPVVAVIVPILKLFAKEKGEDTSDIPDVPPPPPDLEPDEPEEGDKDKPEKDDEESFFQKNKMVIYIGGGIAAALVLTLIISATMKKK